MLPFNIPVRVRIAGDNGLKGDTSNPSINSSPSKGFLLSSGRVFNESVASPISSLEINEVEVSCPCLILPVVSTELMVNVSGLSWPNCHGAALSEAVKVASIGSFGE